MTAWELGVALAAVTLGSLVQGALGFGLSLVVAPTLTLVQPDALPATILFLALPMTAVMALRERGAVDGRGVAFASAGRVVGTAGGVALVSAVADDRLSVLVGAVIVAAVALSVFGPALEPGARTTLLAGTASGVMGTVAAVGGAPLALAYQTRPGPEVRSTLAVVFVVGTLVSLGALAVVGHVRAWHALLALELTPAMALGLALSGRAASLLDRAWLRPAILTFAALGGAAAVAEGLLG